MKETIQKYTITGVPASSIPALMKELGLKEENFYNFMRGQTGLLIGNEPVYFVEDIERFASRKPVID